MRENGRVGSKVLGPGKRFPRDATHLVYLSASGPRSKCLIHGSEFLKVSSVPTEYSEAVYPWG